MSEPSFDIADVTDEEVEVKEKSSFTLPDGEFMMSLDELQTMEAESSKGSNPTTNSSESQQTSDNNKFLKTSSPDLQQNPEEKVLFEKVKEISNENFNEYRYPRKEYSQLYNPYDNRYKIDMIDWKIDNPFSNKKAKRSQSNFDCPDVIVDFSRHLIFDPNFDKFIELLNRPEYMEYLFSSRDVAVVQLLMQYKSYLCDNEDYKAQILRIILAKIKYIYRIYKLFRTYDTTSKFPSNYITYLMSISCLTKGTNLDYLHDFSRSILRNINSSGDTLDIDMEFADMKLSGFSSMKLELYILNENR